MSVVANLYYFPSISYICDVIQQKELLLEIHENYQKRSDRNRCRILGSHGIEHLHIPLKKGKNQGQNIRDVRMAYDEDWRKVHWRALTTNYGGAPYFIHYRDQLEALYALKETYLFDFNHKALSFILEQLKADLSVKHTSDFVRNYSDEVNDIRDNFDRKEVSTPIVPYPQVFSHKVVFTPNLSILDLLMCQGPYALLYLKNLGINRRQPTI